jgi:hypothetical protein
MEISQFKKNNSITGNDKILSNQNQNLLTILNYFLNQTKSSGCTDVTISKVENPETIVLTSPTCTSTMKTILNDYVKKYQKDYGFEYTQSGNYTTLKVKKSETQNSSPKNTDSNSTNVDDTSKEIFMKVAKLGLGLTESKKLTEEIIKIKNLLQ